MATADAAMTGSMPGDRRIGRLSIASWVLYDLANTCFSLGVVTLYFPWLLRDVFGYTKTGEADSKFWD